MSMERVQVDKLLEEAKEHWFFRFWWIIALALVILILGFLIFLLATDPNKENNQTLNSNNNSITTQSSNSSSSKSSNNATSSITWSFNDKDWVPSGKAANCPSPLIINTPVDVSLVSSILYPGQFRGNDFKAHGGFRFDGKTNEDVTVVLPMESYLYRAGRYIESDEVQYIMDFINPCGVMFRFDHLMTLSQDFQTIFQALPEAKPDDSRTNFINNSKIYSAGTIVATAVGHKVNKNVGVDFGMYDLRQHNLKSQDSTWAAGEQQLQKKELTYFAVCWLDYLNAEDQKLLKALPVGNVEGKASDYCQN